jgi:hypothetical protein
MRKAGSGMGTKDIGVNIFGFVGGAGKWCFTEGRGFVV